MTDIQPTLNQLATETSPYLLQHADNPVHWYPWNEEALRLAREQQKPVFLSIGYSACHWCHVMAHESFEDPATASIMNELFINIKVDREERPDLDKIYQRAHQMLTQRPGGWPLTMFLMHDNHVPFFGGTYFPKTPRHGLPAFTDLLNHIADFYRNRRDELQEQNSSLMQAMSSLQTATPSADELDSTALDLARRELAQSTDTQYGGLGKAPKFPHPFALERLLRHWALTGEQDNKSLELACLTLDAMATGGMNDQVGGGFCRYSVDDYWMIPHFEKMLYDNGPLLQVYSYAWQATDKPLYKRTVQRTADWVLREMQSPEGGFWSSLDADSEGPEGKSEEGRFYVWEPEPVKALLSDIEWKVLSRHFGFDREANFEGHWHAHVFVRVEKLADEFNMPIDTIQQIIDSACDKLYTERANRIHPGRDDKVLTSWNALMIKGLAVAGRVFEQPEWISAAERAFDFIRDKLYVDQRLLATYKDGKAHLNAYLDDYVFLIDAGLELLQSRWRDHDLEWLIELADTVLEQFEDKQNGGFFFTSHDHEQLIQRPKPFSDDSVPAGNGIACLALNRLGHILGDTKYTDAVERTLKLAKSQYDNYPSAHNSLMNALEEVLHSPEIITLRGNPQDLASWKQALGNRLNPRRITLTIPAGSQTLPGILSQRVPQNDNAMAWVCRGHQCQPPAENPDTLLQQLS